MRLTVSLTDDALQNADAVLNEARKAGFKLDSFLDAIGIAVGESDPGAVQRLRAINGIKSVEEDREVGIL